MKKINAIISSFAFLLLAVLMSACNKDGIETIVIEDGQPSLAQMLIGRWNPTGGEMANPNTGEVTEDINISDIPWLDFGENGIGSWGNGGSGTGGSAGESFDWNAAVEAVMTVKVLLLLLEANVGISSSLPSVS